MTGTSDDIFYSCERFHGRKKRKFSHLYISTKTISVLDSIVGAGLTTRGNIKTVKLKLSTSYSHNIRDMWPSVSAYILCKRLRFHAISSCRRVCDDMDDAWLFTLGREEMTPGGYNVEYGANIE